MIITVGAAGAAGTALALAAALPAWAEPAPGDTDDPAYRAGYLLGRMLFPLGCLVVLVLLVATLVILLRRRRDRRDRQLAQMYAQAGYPPQPYAPPGYPPQPPPGYPPQPPYPPYQ